MSADHHRRRTLRIASREIGLIVGFGLVVLLVVGFASVVVSRSTARQQALSEAARTTQALATIVVAPLLPAYLDDPAGGTETLDRALGYGLARGRLAGVTLWRQDGSVAYSTEPSAIGQRFDPPHEVVDAVHGAPSSRVASGGGPAGTPTAASPAQGPSYVRVYEPLALPGEEPLALEASYHYAAVGQISAELLSRFLPLILLPLILLQLIQLPAALSLASRLRRKEDERAQLFTRALDVSDRERARFAADLHDGPVQELSGVGYALAALAPSFPAEQAPMLKRVQAAVQRSVDSLRSLMTDLYPPDLTTGTLAEALDALAQPLRDAGLTVSLDLDGLPELERETAVTLYRVTREVLANVQKHARATRVSIAAGRVPAGTGDGDRVRLVVQDDGVGADPRRLDRRREGHLGLRLVIDRVHDAGGELTLTSAPGQGIRVQTDLPIRS